MSHSFDSAATTYNKFAKIQHITADYLVKNAPILSVKRCLDIGCGTGLLTQKIQAVSPELHIDAVDCSREMVAQMAMSSLNNVRLFCTDYLLFEPDDYYDLIMSNAALHWMDMSTALTRMALQLAPNGQCFLAIYGQDTAKELQDLLTKLRPTRGVPAAHFLDSTALQHLGDAVFSTWSVVTQHYTITFDSIQSLLLTQKKTGVNGNVGSADGLWTPRFIQRLSDAFNDTYHQIQLTYQVHFCHGKQ
ncbi:MAG: methyltransferase domain-containing protein [Candidatus Marinamargulisbacteria bacterium]